MTKPANLMTFAERLTIAIEAEGRGGRTQNDLARQAGLESGQISNYKLGNRGGSTIAVDKLRALASVLHVTFDWLAFGEGPMRKGGREPTPAEEAMVFARRSGTREDAWQSAWERFKDREASMTAMDWAVAIHNEAQLLDRGSVQPVESLGAPVPPARVDAGRKPSRRRGLSSP